MKMLEAVEQTSPFLCQGRAQRGAKKSVLSFIEDTATATWSAILTFVEMIAWGVLGTLPSLFWAIAAKDLARLGLPTGSPSMYLASLFVGFALGFVFAFMRTTYRAKWRRGSEYLIPKQWFMPQSEEYTEYIEPAQLRTYLKVPAVPFLSSALFPLLMVLFVLLVHEKSFSSLLSSAPYFPIVYVVSVLGAAWSMLWFETLRCQRNRALEYSALFVIVLSTLSPALYVESMRLRSYPLLQQASWFLGIVLTCGIVVLPTVYRYLFASGVSDSISRAVAGVCAFIVGVPPIVTIWREKPEAEIEPHIDGAKLSPVPSVLLEPQSPTDIFFGRVFLPLRIMVLHLLLIGSPRSGKTVMMRLCMQSALIGRVGAGIGHKAFVYDFKREWLQTLAGMGFYPRTAENPDGLVIIIEPRDKRAYALSLSKENPDAETSRKLAEELWPIDPQAKDKFFEACAQQLGCGVLTSFMEAWHRSNGEFDYGLDDVIYTMRDLTRLRRVIEQLPAHVPDRDDLITNYLDTADSTLRCIRTELARKTAPYLESAAAWSRARAEGRTFSITDWIHDRKGSILILTMDSSTSEALKTLYRVIFKRLTTLVLALPNSSERSISLWLDEVQTAAFEELPNVITNGPSKGMWGCFAFQTQAHMREAFKEQAQVIWGEPANKLFFRTEDAATAKVCEEQTGTERKWQISYGKNKGESVANSQSKNWGVTETSGSGPGGSSSSTSVQNGGSFGITDTRSKGESTQWAIAKAELVPFSEFREIPRTNFDTDESCGLKAFQRCPYSGEEKPKGWSNWIHLTAAELRKTLMEVDKKVLASDPRTNRNDLYLQPWSFARWELFKGKTSRPNGAFVPQAAERERLRARIVEFIDIQTEREKEHELKLLNPFTKEDIMH
jgi:hypothetical protein